ncbi:hypothetical protein GCM10022379_16480 [Micromonospora maritima]
MVGLRRSLMTPPTGSRDQDSQTPGYLRSVAPRFGTRRGRDPGAAGERSRQGMVPVVDRPRRAKPASSVPFGYLTVQASRSRVRLTYRQKSTCNLHRAGR